MKRDGLLYKLRTKLTELVAPVEFRCLSCGKDVFDEIGFCEDCRKSLPYNNGKTCLRCGVALDGENDYCGNCAEDKIYFDKAYSPFCYDGAVRKAILAMKFGNCGSYARVLARYLAFAVNKYNVPFDVVVPVPMSAASYKKRGYNQAELLARGFCDIMGVNDKFANALVKVKDTAPQEKLGRKERKENLVGCIRVKDEFKQKIKGKIVLLVDDIKTTGATINECAKALKLKGATAVYAVTVASRAENFLFEVDGTM